MPTKRLIRPLAQLLVILFAVALLFHFWHANPPAPAPVGGGDNDEDDVKYSPIVPVSVAPITIATLHASILAYGVVEPAPASAESPAAGASIRVAAPALVAEVHCIEGQRVEQGQPLFRLDDRPASLASDRAKAQLAAADESLARFGKATDVPQQYRLRAQVDRDQAQAALDAAIAQKGMLNFTSPLSGTIVQLNIRTGELADPSRTAVQVVDLSRLVIALSVPGWQLHDIKPGQEVEIIPRTNDADAVSTTAPATGPASTVGKVVFIDPQVDASTGMGSIDVAPPAGMQLRIGEFVSARIVSEEHKDCLTVPASSLVRDANDTWGISLAVRDFHGAVRHPVKVGIIEGDRAEVSGEGIAAGAYVVTTGAAALPDKSKIEVVK